MFANPVFITPGRYTQIERNIYGPPEFASR